VTPGISILFGLCCAILGAAFSDIYHDRIPLNNGMTSGQYKEKSMFTQTRWDFFGNVPVGHQVKIFSGLYTKVPSGDMDVGGTRVYWNCLDKRSGYQIWVQEDQPVIHYQPINQHGEPQ
jgi:hypothetical protein